MTLHCVQVDAAVAVSRGVLEWLAPGDAFLLLGPATALARSGHPLLDRWLERRATPYALCEDLALHGINAIDERVLITDYAGWVELAVRQPQQLLWT